MSDTVMWSGYINQLNSKEGLIADIINYLSNNENKNLLEISSVNLKDKFPVIKIISLIHNEDFLTGKNLNEKIAMLQKIFEILFGYSKNLLIKFDIYRDKSIKINTFQIVNYLSELPDFSNYLALIGYLFYENNQEWRFSEKKLSNERRTILQYLTVCCAVGYDYWNDCLKYLFLTIFTDQRLSMDHLMNEQNCEFCEFELDKSNYRCAVCLTEIKKMSFFGRWQSEAVLTQRGYSSLETIKEHSQNARQFFSFSITKSNNSICTHSTNDYCNKCCSDYKLNNNNTNTNTISWTCECSYVNKMNQVNCSMCYKERTNQNSDEKVLVDKSNFIELPSNFSSNDNNKTVKVEQKKQMELQSESNDDEDEWECEYCTTKNKMNIINCSICFKENPNKPTPRIMNNKDEGDNKIKQDIDAKLLLLDFNKDNGKIYQNNQNQIKDIDNKGTTENSKILIPDNPPAVIENEDISNNNENGIFVLLVNWVFKKVLHLYSWFINIC